MAYRDFTIRGDWVALHESTGDAPDRLIRISSIDSCHVEDAKFKYKLNAWDYACSIDFDSPDQGSEHFDNYANLSLAWALLDALLERSK